MSLVKPGAVATVLIVALVAAGCGSGSSSTTGSESESEEGATIKTPSSLAESGKLTVCTDPTYPPLESYGENKELTGFDVESARATAEKLGLEASFKPTAFSGILPALDAGRCDLAWSGLFVNKERTEQFTAVPYQKSTTVLMVKGGNPENINSPKDLSGKTLVSQNGTELLEFAKEISAELEEEGLPGAEVQGYNGFDEVVQQLAIGRAAAVTTQDIEASYRELKQPGEFETAYRFPKSEYFGAYMKPDNKELAQGVYKALKQLEEEGTLKTIAEEQGMPTEGINVKPPVGP
jgi:polar amino acid transport system substrate-binding protein